MRIGTCLRGLTRRGWRRKCARWMASHGPAVYRAVFVLSYPVFEQFDDASLFFYLGITICVDSTPGSDLPSSQSHMYMPVLMSLSSSTIVIQCCKATDILGVSSAFYLTNSLTQLIYPPSGPTYTSIAISTLTRSPSCARMTKCSVCLFRASVWRIHESTQSRVEYRHV